MIGLRKDDDEEWRADCSCERPLMYEPPGSESLSVSLSLIP